ncbi:MAG: TIM barrel oxidoreductase NifR3 [Clostridiaceae bacterium BRH_c20a]|nr:MAG: TIM barrel oxidoreductase NifR3 [Clostridiaceae bacterium BRH_c20a]
MQIGNIAVDNPVVLAPMAGVTDKAFRILVKEQGCGLIYTEMVSAKALTYRNERTFELINLEDELPPISVQIFGSEPSIMAEGAKIVEEHGANIIDINMGCPVPKVVKNLEGSALMLDSELAYTIVEKVVQSVKVPVTVKIRKGWDGDKINAVEFAKRMEAAGASLIAVHGRTRCQMYSGTADWNIIKAVKEAVKVPVIGNGDIFSAKDALRMFKETGCDAVMVGRGAMGNPWLFAQITTLISKGEEIPPPSLADRILMAIKHAEFSVKYKAEKIAIKEMRKHIGWYFKGLPHGARMRDTVNKMSTLDDLKELLYRYLDQSGS